MLSKAAVIRGTPTYISGTPMHVSSVPGQRSRSSSDFDPARRANG
jgi:hypothetical protein